VQRTELEALPKYTPWVARVLGLESFARPVRDFAKIHSEYEIDKYAKLLAYYRERDGCTMQDVKTEALSTLPKEVCISREGHLYLTTTDDYQPLEDQILCEAIREAIAPARAVVELGCGYGYCLSVFADAYPDRVWIGGDFSQNAITLANLLFSDRSSVSVVPFNWLDETWPILEALEDEALIFTRHSVEQLPEALHAFRTFRKYERKILGVVHFEPVYELHDSSSLLGNLRQAYTVLNDYNRDLLTAVKALGGQVVRTQHDLVGLNSLNPTSLVYWRF